MRSYSSRSLWSWPKTPASATQTVVILLLLCLGATAAWLPPRTKARMVAPFQKLAASASATVRGTPTSKTKVGVQAGKPSSAPRFRLVSSTKSASLPDRTTRATRTFVVNSTADLRDANAGDGNAGNNDGVCATSAADGGVCTLRAALDESNESTSGGASITFDPTVFAAPRKTIKLAINPPIFRVFTNPVSIVAPAAGVNLEGTGRFNIFDISSDATFTGVTFINGIGIVGGGAISVYSGRTTIDRCTFTGNVAHEGGAIFVGGGGELILRNSTISNNGADNAGGAIYNQGQTTIQSSTISSNYAPQDRGGGIASVGGATSGNPTPSVLVSNSVIAGNALTDVDFIEDPLGTITPINNFDTLGFNFIGVGNAANAFDASGDIVGPYDPRLDALRENGGPTQTRQPFVGSPLIDQGKKFSLTTDQRGTGFSRTYEDVGTPNATGGDGTDIGSFEDQPILGRTNTTLDLTGSPNPSAVSENVIFEARLIPRSGAFPTGTITFKINGAVVATRTISANSRTAIYETTFGSVGARTVVADYSGDSDFNTSTDTITQTVQNATVSTIVVDTTSDAANLSCTSAAGDCSLRSAINQANSSAGRQTINFAIPGSGVQTITPATPLPAITGAVTIQGFSQGGATSIANTNASGAINATPLIELNGANAGAHSFGLRFVTGSSGSIVRGLSIGGFEDGIVLESSRNTVAGCFLGVRADGTTTRPNTSSGVRVENSASNTIGGAVAADRNLISGNALHGVEILQAGSSGNTVQNNLIGPDKTISYALSTGISADGVIIALASNNTVKDNFIGGHGNAQTSVGGQGVAIGGLDASDNTARNNVVIGNTISSNATDGIAIASAQTTRIGGTTAAERNIIAANGDDGLQILGSSYDSVIQGNFIGTFDGTTADGNTDDGISIVGGARGVLVGGTVASARNIIVANGDIGISIEDDTTRGNTVQGNFIGLNAAGTGALGNVGNGVVIQDSSGNIVGGATAAQRNVIAGNQSAGVGITGAAIGNRIQGNYLGVNVNGLALGARSPDVGVLIFNAGGNAIIGNLIANHAGAGVQMEGTTTTGNSVSGNKMGLNASGAAAPNQGGVFFFSGAHDNIVGGTAATANTIAFNDGPGVAVVDADSDNNTISFNSMRANGSIGIDLGGDGASANDTGDADTGPNQGQNAPAIQSVSNTQIVARLASAAGTYRIEFFATDAREASGNVEGQTFLGAQNVTVSASGPANATLTLSGGVPANRFITTTATDAAGNTSEFSPAVQAPPIKINTSTVVTSSRNPSQVGQSVTFTATVAPASGTTKPTGSVTFRDATTTIGTATLNTVGVATFATSALSIGTHPISAVYGGSTSFNASTSATINQVVNAAPTLSIGDVSVTEGNTGSSIARFLVTLSRTPTSSVSVRVDTAAGTTNTATAGSDYTTISNRVLTFAANTTTLTQNVDVTIIGDTTIEPNETFLVNLSAATGATLADGTATGTIKNDDVKINTTTALTSSRNPSQVGQSVTFTATVAPASGTTKPTGSVTFRDGTTTLGTAALNTAGIATFATSALAVGTHPITAVYGGSTSFNASTSATTNQVVNAAPTLSIGDVSVTEGSNSSSQNSANFAVTLSRASTLAVSVSFVTANGSATAPGDFTARSGVLTIPVGATTGTISVLVVGDTTDEPNETFTVSLSNPSGATIGDGAATGTITDDDAAPKAYINDRTVTEGNSGTQNVAFTVTLSNASSTAQAINFAAANGTALAGSDYTATSGTLTIPAGQTTGAINVAVIGDTLVESNETFTVNLSLPSQTRIVLGDAQGLGTITNDDALPTLSIGDASVTEGNSGSSNIARFAVRLSRTPNSAVTVRVNTALISNQATANDFTAISNRVLTFTANTTTLVQNVDVTIIGDATIEPNETFLVNLSAPTGATLADSQALGTIVNDDKLNTTTKVTSSRNPSQVGQSVTFTATVTPASGTTKPTGSVTFRDGTTTLGTGTLNTAGVATFATSALKQATHPITAVYGGSTSYNGSTSTTINQVVNSAPTIR